MAFMKKASRGLAHYDDSAIASLYYNLLSAFKLESLQEWLDCIYADSFEQYFHDLHKSLRQTDVYEGFVKERGEDNKAWIIDMALWNLIQLDKGVLECALIHAANPDKEPLEELPDFLRLKHLQSIYKSSV